MPVIGKGFFFDCRSGWRQQDDALDPRSYKKASLKGRPCVLRKERDSNPRSLAAQRFSRPPRSTTPPSFRTTKVTWIFHSAKSYPAFRTEDAVSTRACNPATREKSPPAEQSRRNFRKKIPPTRFREEDITMLLHFMITPCPINFFYDFCIDKADSDKKTAQQTNTTH